MRDGKIREHEVKPLELIWRKFPEIYNESNTVHVDDLSRNFALNPQPRTLNPEPQTLNLECYTLNPKPCTLNPKSQTPNPKP